MRRGPLRNTAWTLASIGVGLALSACGASEDPNSTSGPNGAQPAAQDGGAQAPSSEEQVRQILDQRKTDYGEALRTASLKLRDEFPSLDEIKQLEAAPDDAAKKTVYEGIVDKMLDDPRFARTMVKFWKDTFRTGQVGTPQNGAPNKDTAATFAAQVTVEGRSYGDLFTANTNTCPTFDTTAGTFTPAACSGGGPTAGVLTDPGLLAQYYANMAFRRVRFVQETFVCSKFPATISSTPKPMGNGTYTGAYEFTSISGKENNPQARVDFHDTQAVICANCHSDLNHIAPAFANWDDKGAMQASIQVKVPIPGTPAAKRIDWLPDAEGLSWRLGKPFTDLPSLGQLIAADPDVARCAVNRVWNYAMSRGDIVNDLATVPNSVTDPLVKSFTDGGMKLKETIRAVFKSEDFTKF